jgi:hypothetical protein
MCVPCGPCRPRLVIRRARGNGEEAAAANRRDAIASIPSAGGFGWGFLATASAFASFTRDGSRDSRTGVLSKFVGSRNLFMWAWLKKSSVRFESN